MPSENTRPSAEIHTLFPNGVPKKKVLPRRPDISVRNTEMPEDMSGLRKEIITRIMALIAPHLDETFLCRPASTGFEHDPDGEPLMVWLSTTEDGHAVPIATAHPGYLFRGLFGFAVDGIIVGRGPTNIVIKSFEAFPAEDLLIIHAQATALFR
jgi:hypothetical protein